MENIQKRNSEFGSVLNRKNERMKDFAVLIIAVLKGGKLSYCGGVL